MVNSNLISLSKIVEGYKKENKSIAFISGVFQVVHPGHIRLFQTAKSLADILIIGILADDMISSVVTQQERLMNISNINSIDRIILVEGNLEEILLALEPNYVVKGKEFEDVQNEEKSIVEKYGGNLIFSPGNIGLLSEKIYSSEIKTDDNKQLISDHLYLTKHNVKKSEIKEYFAKTSSLKVLVLGEVIVDEYINCEPLGMSQEDPTIVVSPLENNKFFGGAGIVAAHAASIGCDTHLISVIGNDEAGEFSLKKAEEFNIKHAFFKDISRVTPLKKRYRALGKTMLRVNHLRQHNISDQIAADVFEATCNALDNADLLIFSDFSYGVLTDKLVDKIKAECFKKNVMIAADSQSSSQFGDISKYSDVTVLTPNEREARLALRDFDSGLENLARNLQEKLKIKHLVITLSKEGVLLKTRTKNEQHNEEFKTDRIRALNQNPVDVAGGGDSFLVTTSIMLAAGMNIYKSIYVGSVAAGIQVSRIGNTPITKGEIENEF